MITASIRVAGPLVTVFISINLLAVANADDLIAPHIAALKSPTGSEAYKSVSALHRMGPDAAEAVPALIEALYDHRFIDDEFIGPIVPTIGWSAARALAAIGQPAVVPLIEVLGERDVGVRLKAINALARIGVPAAEAEPALRKLARNDEIDSVRINALDAVPRVSNRPAEEVIAFLQEWLLDRDPEMRALVVRWLGRYGAAAKAAVPQLIVVLDDDALRWQEVADVRWQVPFRRDVANSLGQVGPPAQSALPRLRRMMHQDQDESVRVAAAGAIARIDPSDTESIEIQISALEPSAQRQNPDTDALSHLADLPQRSQAAIEKIEALTAHDDSWVQVDAIRTLRALSGTKAIPILTRAL